jgi:hypothetical protein
MASLSTKYSDKEIMDGIDGMSSFIIFRRHLQNINDGLYDASPSELIKQLTLYVKDIKRGIRLIKLTGMELTPYEKHIYDLINNNSMEIYLDDVTADEIKMTTIVEFIIYYSFTRSTFAHVIELALIANNFSVFNYFWSKLKQRCINDSNCRKQVANKLLVKAVSLNFLSAATIMVDSVCCSSELTNVEVNEIVEAVIKYDSLELTKFAVNFMGITLKNALIKHPLFPHTIHVKSLVTF